MSQPSDIELDGAWSIGWSSVDHLGQVILSCPYKDSALVKAWETGAKSAQDHSDIIRESERCYHARK